MASCMVGPITELFEAGTLVELDDAELFGRFLADGAAGGRAFELRLLGRRPNSTVSESVANPPKKAVRMAAKQ